MNRGIYVAASGGLLETKRLQVVADNLANVNTVGFKAARLVTKEQEFSDTLASVIGAQPERAEQDHKRAPGVVDVATVTDFSPGPISPTGNPLHVALQNPKHFFVLAAAEGELLTRAGNFTRGRDGTLTTVDGAVVAGEGGQITLREGAARITNNGTVFSNGEVVGRLRVVEVDNLEELERREGARFLPRGAEARDVRAEILPESVELPNVSVIEAMVEMIAVQRSFEGYTKTVQTMQELNDVAMRNARGSA